MSDLYKKVTRGQSLVDMMRAGEGPFNADWYNKSVDIFRWAERTMGRTPATEGGPPELDTEFWIANGTFTDLAQGAIVGFTTIASDPALDTDNFWNESNFYSASPTNGSQFAILLEPIRAAEHYKCIANTTSRPPNAAYWTPVTSGAGLNDRGNYVDGAAYVVDDMVALPFLGRAVVSGEANCLINVTDAAHGYAAPAIGVYTRLTSQAAAGPAKILWKASGTGEKKARVLLDQNNGIAGSGIISINGGTTPAQLITSTGGTVAITQPNAATTNLEVANVGIDTINGDGTAAQVFGSSGGTVTITDTGPGTLNFEVTNPGIDTINGGTGANQQIGLNIARADVTVDNFTSAYSAALLYRSGCLVTSAGSTYRYVNATPTSGNAPPNATYWLDVTGQDLTVLNLPYASATLAGAVSIVDQAYAGLKDFTAALKSSVSVTIYSTLGFLKLIPDQGVSGQFCHLILNGRGDKFTLEGTGASNLQKIGVELDAIGATGSKPRFILYGNDSAGAVVQPVYAIRDTGPTDYEGAWATVSGLVFKGGLYISGSITGFQPLDATLTAFAALTIAANSLIIGTGVDAFSVTTFAANTFPARASTGDLVAKTITDFGLSLVDDADAAAARTTLGITSPTDGINVDVTSGQVDALTKTISVSLSSNQNDYNPTGFAVTAPTTSRVRINCTAVSTLTGLVAGADGQIVTLQNVGTNAITLADEDAASSAANRFSIFTIGTGVIVLLADHCAILQYDGTSSRWRHVAGGVYKLSASNLVGNATGSAEVATGIGIDSTLQFSSGNLGVKTTGTGTGVVSIAVATISGGTLTQQTVTGNVASISRTAMSTYDIAFTTAYASQYSYALSGSSDTAGTNMSVSARSTTGCTVVFGVADPGWLCVTLAS